MRFCRLKSSDGRFSSTERLRWFSPSEGGLISVDFFFGTAEESFFDEFELQIGGELKPMRSANLAQLTIRSERDGKARRGGTNRFVRLLTRSKGEMRSIDDVLLSKFLFERFSQRPNERRSAGKRFAAGRVVSLLLLRLLLDARRRWAEQIERIVQHRQPVFEPERFALTRIRSEGKRRGQETKRTVCRLTSIVLVRRTCSNRFAGERFVEGESI